MIPTATACPHGTLILRRTFSCAHFYAQPQWDETQNRKIFGKCFTRYGHGHDYRVEVGFQVDDNLSEKVEICEQILCSVVDPVIETLDHQHLNFAIPEFKDKVPTTENLALYLQAKIEAALASHQEFCLLGLRLFETPTLWVELS
jgi:6-pyruvoyltetrahydropterin/6-carboxytetrahydropterin synthase